MITGVTFKPFINSDSSRLSFAARSERPKPDAELSLSGDTDPGFGTDPGLAGETVEAAPNINQKKHVFGEVAPRIGPAITFPKRTMGAHPTVTVKLLPNRGEPKSLRFIPHPPTSDELLTLDKHYPWMMQVHQTNAKDSGSDAFRSKALYVPGTYITRSPLESYTIPLDELPNYLDLPGDGLEVSFVKKDLDRVIAQTQPLLVFQNPDAKKRNHFLVGWEKENKIGTFAHGEKKTLTVKFDDVPGAYGYKPALQIKSNLAFNNFFEITSVTPEWKLNVVSEFHYRYLASDVTKYVVHENRTPPHRWPNGTALKITMTSPDKKFTTRPVRLIQTQARPLQHNFEVVQFLYPDPTAKS